MQTAKAPEITRGLIARLIDASWWRVLLLWVFTMLLRHFIGALAVTFVLAYAPFEHPDASPKRSAMIGTIAETAADETNSSGPWLGLRPPELMFINQ